jgi:uncharacterized phage protein gp47/JayE
MMAGLTTNVPGITWTPSGLVLPTEQQLLAGWQADLNQAFGGNLNPALNTPQGQLASSGAGILSASNDLFAFFVNQVNPDNNSGFMQDAIGRIYFMTRNPGLPTIVQCVCSGDPGTYIGVGALAQDTSLNIYSCTQAGQIPSSGSITLPFANQSNGPIACPAGTLTKIYQGITGWESINNTAAGIAGANVESTAAFAFRRQQSVAANSTGSTQAILGAVFGLPGVIDAYVIDNGLNIPAIVGATNYSVAPKSVYVAVVGGDPQAIAQAIWSKKDLGCGYNGNTTMVVQDTDGYALPYPSYNVTFNIPTATPILYAVALKNSPSLPSNIVALVQAAIVKAFTGQIPNIPRARIGALILAATYYAPVAAIDPSVQVLSILLGANTPTFTSWQMGIDQVPTCTAAQITVTLV